MQINADWLHCILKLINRKHNLEIMSFFVVRNSFTILQISSSDYKDH